MSESNAALEVENRKLRASLVGMREALKKNAREEDVTDFDLAYNLTHLLGIGAVATPQLEGRNINVHNSHQLAREGVVEDVENEIPTTTARKMLRDTATAS